MVRRRSFLRWARPEASSLCADCGMETWPTETFMLADEVWAEARGGRRCLCVGCVEDRLARVLEPADFPALPLNDDAELDTVRLRLRKGSGRRTYELYELATRAVVDLGADLDDAAERLGLEVGLLRVWVDGRRARDAAA